ncbi:MAG: hypothetical protein NVSMB57_01040 [Actinomycetota bacterium]
MTRKIIVAAALLAMLGGCSSGPKTVSTPSASSTPRSERLHSNATLAILSPTPGQVVHGTTLVTKVKVNGAKIIPQATLKVRPDEGHLHLRLDGTIVTILASQTYTLTKLKKGRHLLQAEFVAGNHVPFDPRIIQEITFSVV